ncbi:bacillithiol system redox-active protein YtxJ [uncultured Chryseobacterium sp.]|uniref:bacillithiol system redox-active protein YtxJ n=1 Tax=uncultured Chryseobacterium sp. TaxID=259322 RepID=UPI002603A970|nr:bacillithiol system redox-active protein YtxJ [uncultured Chryseobacterium sp.]
MSIFGNLFNGKDEASPIKSFWKTITSEEELQQAIENSYQNKTAIFKHSTSCFISKTILKNFEKEIENINEADQKITFYYLDLLKYRSVSNKIAEMFEIRHESPQLIIIENGKAIGDASHQDISLSQI